MIRNILSISCSDSSGSAGIQADLKTCSALGAYGANAVTALTAQNTQMLSHIFPASIDNLEHQLQLVLDDLRIDAIKIGMLPEIPTICSVYENVKNFEGPIVMDPMMVSRFSLDLVDPNVILCLKEVLMPTATLLTPNVPEAAILLNQPEASTSEALIEQGYALLESGAQAVLMKGGHLESEVCVDWLITHKKAPVSFAFPRVATMKTQGIGCTYSAAIAIFLSQGLSLERAVSQAHKFVYQTILYANDLQVGQGAGPTHHFHALWSKASQDEGARQMQS